MNADVDPNRLCEIWDAHHARVLLIARSVGSQIPDMVVEDAVQEAFVALAKQDAEPTDVLAWLVRASRNRVLDSFRGEARRRRRETSHGLARWFSDPNPPTIIDSEQLTRAVESLPEQARQIVTMHVWGEMSFQAIADVLGISASSAHRHYQRALRELKQHFQPRDQHVTR